MSTERWRSAGGNGASDLDYMEKNGTPFPLRCIALFVAHLRLCGSQVLAESQAKSVAVGDFKFSHAVIVTLEVTCHLDVFLCVLSM